MHNKAYLGANLGIACLALLLAVSVYLFARPSPPELLSALHWRSDWLAGYNRYLGSAPALFYTLAIGILVGLSALTRSAARRHCLIWILVAACLEATQASAFADRLTAWLEPVVPDGVWRLVGPYWQRGVFDPLDLAATFVGGAIALLVLSRFASEEVDDGEA